jgi:pyruvate dehydrogenase E2 component (dihydrolipoamide acetyltransferase)
MQTIEVRVPDIGDFKDIPIIELLVEPGDVIQPGDPLLTLESDKATLDVPAPLGGRVASVAVAPGNKVSHGSLILRLIGAELSEVQAADVLTVPDVTEMTSAPTAAISQAMSAAASSLRTAPSRETHSGRVYASPSIRLLARSLGVDLAGIVGSGRRGRVLLEDVHTAVRARVAITPSAPPDGLTTPLPSQPAIDFSRFGAIERQPLSRIRRISGPALARNWASIPHVTNFDEADVTELEKFRLVVNAERGAGVKVTMLSFLVKACASALRGFPAFNASLDGCDLILKKYVHVGVAVDTDAGLLVPVVRDADQSGLLQIADEIGAKAASARAGKLKLADMEGGCFTVSSLGGIGGTGFTPIINAPEVAILGAGKAAIRPQWDGQQFQPRLILPLSLSWDHRALDGAAAARFLVHLVQLLQDFRRVLL